MSIWELMIIAVGLSMDAFAVAICKGLSVEKVRTKYVLTVGLYFGGFQALMPLIGYFIGSSFESFITKIDHWIAFLLLAMIGINMIKESRGKSKQLDASFTAKSMFPLAIATSIDALAVGITFAFLNVQIIPAVSLIGIITCILSAVGLKLGNAFGVKHKSKAEILGGVVLIFMGIKIILDHIR